MPFLLKDNVSIIFVKVLWRETLLVRSLDKYDALAFRRVCEVSGERDDAHRLRSVEPLSHRPTPQFVRCAVA